MKLYARIDSEELLFSLRHELGASFYRPMGNGEFEVLYYSGNRVVHFKGKLSEDKAKILEQTAWKVDQIEIDEAEGYVRIVQA